MHAVAWLSMHSMAVHHALLHYMHENSPANHNLQDKLAEEEAARLKDEPKSDLDDDDEETETFADKFIALFDRPPLDKFKEQAAPFLDWLEEHPNSIWLIIAGPIFVLLSIVRRLFFGKKV